MNTAEHTHAISGGARRPDRVHFETPVRAQPCVGLLGEPLRLTDFLRPTISASM